MVARAIPVRVGGNSGPCYEDQKELTWADISNQAGKQIIEKGTKTGRVRRPFTFSKLGFEHACHIDKPNYIVISFGDYIHPSIAGLRNRVYGSRLIEDERSSDCHNDEAIYQVEKWIKENIPALTTGGPDRDKLLAIFTGPDVDDVYWFKNPQNIIGE